MADASTADKPLRDELLDPRSARFRFLAALGVLTAVVALFGWEPSKISWGPNVVLIVTDDQSFGSIPRSMPPMPFLQARIEDPSDEWVRFPNAFVNTSLCCPSRATILSGEYAHHTGVLRNSDGFLFDDASTIATWLDAAGYHTGLVGKYLNRYPFGRDPFVPPGWDVWLAKVHGGPETVYFGYRLFDGRRVTRYGVLERDYLTDVLRREAVSFIDNAPGGRPFFLYFAPTAPHAPWTPPPRYEGAFSDLDLEESPAVDEDRSDKPSWIRALPDRSGSQRERLRYERRNEYETLLAVDDAVEAIVHALERRGALEDTVIVFLSDNGYAYGEHGIVGKRCLYDACSRVPFFIRFPGAKSQTVPFAVSNADVAPTLADLAGARPTTPVDGHSLVSLLEGGRPPARRGVLLEWAGDVEVPPAWGYRTKRYLYVEYPETGERELYDLKKDPDQLENVASSRRYRRVGAHLARRLRRLVPSWAWGATEPVSPGLPPVTALDPG